MAVVGGGVTPKAATTDGGEQCLDLGSLSPLEGLASAAPALRLLAEAEDDVEDDQGGGAIQAN